LTYPKGYNSKGQNEPQSSDQHADGSRGGKANIDGYDQTLLERYNDKSTNFWRAMGLVIGFGIFFSSLYFFHL
jgi:hypothetical protein